MTQGLKQMTGIILVDPTSGAPKGCMGADGREYLFAAPTFNGAGVTAPAIDGVVIGATTPALGKFSAIQTFNTDNSGTPGNTTINSTRGRAAFAAAGSSVVVTNSLVTAASTVLAVLGGADATLTSIRVTPGAGTFTVTGNAAATGTTPFDFIVVN